MSKKCESSIYIWITTGEFHTAKSGIVLNNYGAVINFLTIRVA